MTDFWADAKVIYTYTRAQAIKDAVLTDVSAAARVAGFKWPVAVTAGVVAAINNIPPSLKGIQDVTGRLWDVLFMARMAVRRGSIETIYRLHMDRNEGGKRLKMLVLKMVSGPGDDAEPVITIMLENEN